MASGSEQLTRAIRSLEEAFLIGVDGVCEIWLIRHADCYEDMTETNDPPLSALGRTQAARLAERVRRAHPTAVYTSPYRRALQTARTITDEVIVDERLIEMDLGINVDGNFDLTEDPTHVVRRMRSALDDIARRHTGQRVVIVSHAAAIVALLTDILQLDHGRLRILPYYTSVSVLRVLGDRAMVAALTDVAHLE
ncbi:MAG: histidine phosphatase family protein [Candidatus Dormibacterales bacterium]